VAAERIAAGDLSSRVETRNITEIGTLGESFNTMSDKLEEHIASLAKAARENRELFVGTVKALAAAIDGKDKYTRGHSERVARISVAIGRQMALPEDELETLRISALLHDVGKIAIDDNILKNPRLQDHVADPRNEGLFAGNVHAPRDGERQRLPAGLDRRANSASGKDRFGR
jgi:HD-GYP domain-containing protein (c-di-GMP phosphodiesterase class II)